MSIKGVGQNGLFQQLAGTKLKLPDENKQGNGNGAGAVGGKSATDDFLAFVKKTPAERLRDEWLKAHNLTQEELDAMPPEQRAAVEKEIAEEITQKMREKASYKPGENLNVLA